VELFSLKMARRGRRPRDYYSLNQMGVYYNEPNINMIQRRIQVTKNYLIVHRFYGPEHITWSQLSSDFKRLWLVIFDSELDRLLRQWEAVESDWMLKHISRRQILLRYRLLHTRAHLIIPT